MTPKKDSILLLRDLVNGSGKRGENVQEFKSNAQISFKHLLANLPPKTKTLEPINVMVW